MSLTTACLKGCLGNSGKHCRSLLRRLPHKGELHMRTRNPRNYLPDLRDGLTQRERIVLQCIYALQQERGGRSVPTGMLYGTVVEYVDMSVEEMQSILVRLIGDKRLPS
jgi:hypothetical protein